MIVAIIEEVVIPVDRPVPKIGGPVVLEALRSTAVDSQRASLLNDRSPIDAYRASLLKDRPPIDDCRAVLLDDRSAVDGGGAVPLDGRSTGEVAPVEGTVLALGRAMVDDLRPPRLRPGAAIDRRGAVLMGDRLLKSRG